MSYTLPSDEALSDRYREVYFSTTGNHRDAAIAALHAVARLAIEHFIAESVKASGVDVEALARAACERCRSDGPAIGCGGCKRIASAIRTAAAQTEAAVRERIAKWLDAQADKYPNNRIRYATNKGAAKAIREGADRDE